MSNLIVFIIFMCSSIILITLSWLFQYLDTQQYYKNRNKQNAKK
jgi:hypothetical protein